MNKLLALFLAATLSFPGCSEQKGTASDDGQERLCVPNNYVICVCSAGIGGTKRCSLTGKSFGPCINCEAGGILDGCTPGDDYPCDCEDGSEGTYTCQEDGASFDACRGCGQPPAEQSESCPGVDVELAAEEQRELSGNTGVAVDDFQPTCTAKAGPDVVYRVVPGGSGLLTARVQGQGTLDPVLVAWGDPCGGAPLACADSSGSGSAEELSLDVIAGEPLFLGVDSSGDGGPFSLTLQLDGAAPQGGICPGIPVALGLGAPAFFSGSTAGAGPDYSGALACSNTASDDVVYAVQPAASGRLTARLLPQGFDGALYLREASCDSGPQLACSDQAPADQQEEISAQVSAGKTYSLFIDGASPGNYELSLELSQSFCGDNKGSPPEQCDDGNNLGGDGCSPECKVEIDPSSASCPGVGVFVFDTPLLLSGSTDNYGDFEAHPSCGGAGAPDRVFRVMPGQSGTLRARVTSTSFDLLLYARKDSCTGPSAKNLGCDDKFISTPGIQLDLPVTQGVPVWLVIDGYKAGEAGVFALSLSIE